MRKQNRSGRRSRNRPDGDERQDELSQHLANVVQQAFEAAKTEGVEETETRGADFHPGMDKAASLGAPVLPILPTAARATSDDEVTEAPSVFPPTPLETPEAPAEAVGSQLSTKDFESPAPAEPSLRQLPPEPLPARMLNEYVYCPRLFYYEHVEGVFVHNADTLRGHVLHSRVDHGSGAMPSADGGKSETQVSKSETEKPETIHSRSVSLGSERLEVVAKMDLVEARTAEDAEAGELFAQLQVCPVDYKAGSPREGEGGNELWDADKMQLGLQCLILRDNGYLCGEGIIYYRATKQRVRLPITPELEAWVLENIAAARETARGPIPPPLVDSPKCPRCSLVTVCLPDETRMLATRAVESLELRVERTEGAQSNAVSLERSEDRAPSHLTPNPQLPTSFPPRRLMTPRDDTRVLYLNTPGLFVGRRGDVLQVKDKKEVVQEVRASDLSHVSLFGNIQISTQTVQNLCEQEIPITYFSMGGWFYGITRGHALKNVFLRIEQFRQAGLPAVCLGLARKFIAGKIRNQRTMLMRNHVEAPEPILAKLRNSAETALRAISIESLLGIEGAAAAFYFQQFGGMIKAATDAALGGSERDMPARADETEKGSPRQARFCFDFSGRNRRPPTDPVNALLSLAYSLLAKDCTLAALAVGFDPYVGFYHQPRFGRPALALDLMEEFRPLIAESVALTAINTGVITAKDFVSAGSAVNLSAGGRRQFFQVYEQRMSGLITHPVFEYKVSYRRALELQFRLLARVLTGEIPEYIPFTTR